MLDLKIKPNFKALGKRLGKDMKVAAGAIAQLNQDDIIQIERDKFYDLDVNGTVHKLTFEDFEISADDIPGLLIANDADLTVALDLTMTDALLAEGTARELVSRIQTIRKDSDFNVTDRINIAVAAEEKATAAVNQFGDYIKNEVLADDIKLVDGLATGTEVEMPDDVKIWIDVQLNG